MFFVFADDHQTSVSSDVCSDQSHLPCVSTGEVPLAMPVMGDQVTPLQTLAENLDPSPPPSTPIQLTVGMQVVTHMLPEPTRNGRLGTLRSWDPASRRLHVQLTMGRLILRGGTIYLCG